VSLAPARCYRELLRAISGRRGRRAAIQSVVGAGRSHAVPVQEQTHVYVRRYMGCGRGHAIVPSLPRAPSGFQIVARLAASRATGISPFAQSRRDVYLGGVSDLVSRAANWVFARARGLERACHLRMCHHFAAAAISVQSAAAALLRGRCWHEADV
jgi:hypothetical protein